MDIEKLGREPVNILPETTGIYKCVFSNAWVSQNLTFEICF